MCCELSRRPMRLTLLLHDETDLRRGSAGFLSHKPGYDDLVFLLTMNVSIWAGVAPCPFRYRQKAGVPGGSRLFLRDLLNGAIMGRSPLSVGTVLAGRPCKDRTAPVTEAAGNDRPPRNRCELRRQKRCPEDHWVAKSSPSRICRVRQTQPRPWKSFCGQRALE